MSTYIAVDPDRCVRELHQFAMFGSAKTPLKRSLECLTCTAKLGKTAIVAYGEDKGSFGQWRAVRRRADTELDEVIE